MNRGLCFALISAASYRATRVITLDSIGDKPRAWWWRRFDLGTHPLGQLVGCPWCVGFWISGAVVWAVDRREHLPLPLLWWAAASSAVGFMGELERG